MWRVSPADAGFGSLGDGYPRFRFAPPGATNMPLLTQLKKDWSWPKITGQLNPGLSLARTSRVYAGRIFCVSSLANRASSSAELKARRGMTERLRLP